MDQFDNVSVVLKANMYFYGQVTSRTIIFPSGERKTLGIMNVGDYTFGTEKKELMEILAGRVSVQLSENGDWQIFEAGSKFEVDANSSFKIKVQELCDYCCSYLD
ncbi:pyrimidine/purine nucleoside phosphorylase [Aurantivibrio infirmus]